MCKVAQEARQEEKIELAREERDFERREMEMRFRHQRDGASRLMQHQRDIERSIMTDRHQVCIHQVKLYTYVVIKCTHIHIGSLNLE